MTPTTRNPRPTLRPTRTALRLDMARRAAATRAPLPHPHHEGDTPVRHRASAFIPMTFEGATPAAAPSDPTP